jgi:hypothetical protein
MVRDGRCATWESMNECLLFPESNLIKDTDARMPELGMQGQERELGLGASMGCNNARLLVNKGTLAWNHTR